MSLDVSIKPPGEYVCSLDNDGYYWWLFPLFERLAERTGQLIDLYGDATFAGDTLGALCDTLGDARVALENQPERWEVLIGIATGPDGSREVRSTVVKAEMAQLLTSLDEAVDGARTTSAVVSFFGD